MIFFMISAYQKKYLVPWLEVSSRAIAIKGVEDVFEVWTAVNLYTLVSLCETDAIFFSTVVQQYFSTRK